MIVTDSDDDKNNGKHNPPPVYGMACNSVPMRAVCLSWSLWMGSLDFVAALLATHRTACSVCGCVKAQ